jgi:hypothetical protein
MKCRFELTHFYQTILTPPYMYPSKVILCGGYELCLAVI